MKSKRIRSAMWGSIVLTCFAFFLSVSVAFSAPTKISKDLQGRNASDQVDVIVQFNQVPTAHHHQRVFSRGGTLKRELGQFHGAAYRVPASALADLAADPDVAYISPDRPVQSTGTGSPTAVLDHHTESVNAPAAWAQGLDGTGIGVAVIDSGIGMSPDLMKGAVAYRQNFANSLTYNAFTSTVATDPYGHGTHVAGILAGTGKNSTGWNDFYTFKGIASHVNLIDLRVLDQNGQGTDSQVIAAIQTAIRLQSRYNIQVINLSLGRPVWESYTLDPLCQAVEQAWQAGIVVVVAAGNQGRDNSLGTNGYATIQAPGSDPYVITVGAMKTLGTPSPADDLIASYSSKAPTLTDHIVKPDLVAPGNRVVSVLASTAHLQKQYPTNAVPLQCYQNTGSRAMSNQYYTMSGTSMA